MTADGYTTCNYLLWWTSRSSRGPCRRLSPIKQQLTVKINFTLRTHEKYETAKVQKRQHVKGKIKMQKNNIQVKINCEKQALPMKVCKTSQ